MLVLVLSLPIIYNNLLLRLSVPEVLTLASKILLDYANFLCLGFFTYNISADNIFKAFRRKSGKWLVLSKCWLFAS